MRLFFLGLLIAFNAFATDWSDLEVGQSYKLNQSFQLKQLERSGSLLDFSKGDELTLTALIPLSIPGASLALYIFDFKNCPGREMKTDMDIIPVNNTSPLVEVGAQVEECELNVFLELKDYYSASLFQ